MPRPRPSGSAVATPFDYILGTLGGVRVLRVLSATTIPLSQAELARRSDLHSRGIAAVLDGLERAGVVAYVGRGRSRQVQLRQAHPLVNHLASAFRAEAERWPGTQQQLRELVASAGERVMSAWIEGPAATGNDRFTDPIIVTVMTDRPLDLAMQENWRRQANMIQSARYVTIDLRFLERADLDRLSEAELARLGPVVLLRGPSPLDILRATEARVKEGKATRSKSGAARPSKRPAPRPRQIAGLIADKLLREPELVDRAKAYIARRLPLAGASERLTLVEWQGLLDSLTAGQVAALLREESQRADRLRQSLPFLAALSDEERRTVFQEPAATSRPRARRAKR